jgi:hypothetical protein
MEADKTTAKTRRVLCVDVLLVDGLILAILAVDMDPNGGRSFCFIVSSVVRR